ncbi:glycosyltransferase family 4 protein [Aggregatilineales bacterium SYSU G02658]
MNRLFVASGIFHPEPGGPATYLHEALPALQALGWEVRVLTFGAGGGDYPYPVTRVPRGALPLRYGRYAAQAWPHLRWAEVVYAHTIDLPLVTRWRARPDLPRVLKVVGDVAWERAIRKGWVAPGTDIDTFQTMRASRTVEAARRARCAQAQAMTRIITPSDYMRRMVIGWGVDPDRVQVIYNALPPYSGAPLTQAEARAQLGLAARPTLLTAARLQPWKGVDHLITALGHVPDVRLLVAGEGDDLPRLRALATPLGERVQFLGHLPREALYVYMQAADYFVLYSGYEGLAHTLLESLRVGTPLIASARGGNVEVVQHDVNGLLVPYADVSALVEALHTAFAAGQRERLARRTHDGMERFTFEHMIHATDAALRQALRG